MVIVDCQSPFANTLHLFSVLRGEEDICVLKAVLRCICVDR